MRILNAFPKVRIVRDLTRRQSTNNINRKSVYVCDVAQTLYGSYTSIEHLRCVHNKIALENFAIYLLSLIELNLI